MIVKVSFHYLVTWIQLYKFYEISQLQAGKLLLLEIP